MTGFDPAQPRAEFYGLLAELLSFPTSDLAEAISAGEVAHTVHLWRLRCPLRSRLTGPTWQWRSTA